MTYPVFLCSMFPCSFADYIFRDSLNASSARACEDRTYARDLKGLNNND